MDFYSMERLVADRQAEIRRDMRKVAARSPRGSLGVAIAGALRGLADRLDGGRSTLPHTNGEGCRPAAHQNQLRRRFSDS